MMRFAMLTVVLLHASAASAADWPRWRGPTGDGHAPGGGPAVKTLPPEPRVLWSVPLGFGSGSPAVSAARVFYLDNQGGKEVACAASTADGKTIWQVPLDDIWTDSGSEAGPRGTPTVDGDRVYFQSCRGEFRCLAVRDGRQLWRTSFTKDFGAEPLAEAGEVPGATRHGHTGAPLVVGDRIYVMVGGRPNASVVCFDKLTGKVIWKANDDTPGHAGPVTATLGGVRQLVCFMAHGLTGLDPRDGKQLWQVPIRTRLGRHVTTPVVVGDTIVVGTSTYGLVGVRVTSGPSGLVAREAWRDTGLPVDFSNPVSVGAHVYGLGPGSRLFCVEAATGKHAWVEESFFQGALDAGFASFTVIGPNVLVLAERGQLSLVAASAAGCKVLAHTTACGKNWCSPAYVSGRLYIRANKELRCVQIAP